mmetsp:Transcript_59673/g.141984  ORF Transcript_59673/g.141984 Transcript_59673/m.141984 type:complete len:257 (-) Transcript_59673:107-877(-)|eukprot:CAMPEP_0178438746 /NCGR_PEP_ID=MMETSP0689_2-20121128/35766_1 /TAXON_ID=160604 /ORGANISM="Amphidinium massartii, Strain CS-259" /LENGTH=256 /DNA_ID=CAMNT_0020061187 /DNA_START=65 /DNA_END=835 /DNA_ORIENTATION=+
MAPVALRRVPRAAVLILAVASVQLFVPGGDAFVGTLTPKSLRSTRTVAHVGAGYLERNAPKVSDTPFDPRETANENLEVEFKERPFGIMRYQPGKNGKGAMAMEVIPKARYPGDPLGQAATNGVKSGMVVSGINGVDMRSVDFRQIMDLLDDEAIDVRYRPHDASADVQAVLNGKKPMSVELPITVWFSQIPGYQYTGGNLILDQKEGWVLQEDKAAQAAGLLSKLTKEQLSQVRELLAKQALSKIEKYAVAAGKL